MGLKSIVVWIGLSVCLVVGYSVLKTSEKNPSEHNLRTPLATMKTLVHSILQCHSQEQADCSRLKELCHLEGDGDTKSLCSMGEMSDDTKELYRKFAASIELGRVTNRDKWSEVELTFERNGERRNETMVLAQDENGRWLLVSF